jgi:hypothetical protein
VEVEVLGLSQLTEQDLANAHQLLNLYHQDPVACVLQARSQWRLLTPGVLGLTERWSSTDAHTSAALHQALFMIAHFNGDPPADPALASAAEEVLNGRRDAMVVFELLGKNHPFAGLLRGITDLGQDFAQLATLRQLALVAAAMALPRAALLRLAHTNKTSADSAIDSMDLVRGDFKKVMQAVSHAHVAGDSAEEERLLARALDVAAQTPEPYDDICALQAILLFGSRHRLSAETVDRCVLAIEHVLDGGDRSEGLAVATTITLATAQSSDALSTLGERLCRAGRQLLDQGRLAPKVYNPLALAIAGAWIAMGRDDRGTETLDDLETEGALDASARLQIAMTKADIYWNVGDKDNAADVLIEALTQNTEIDANSRLTPLQKLVCVWPPQRAGVGKWLEELVSSARSIGEPQNSLALLTAAVSFVQTGKTAEGKAILARVNLDALKEQVPASLWAMLDAMKTEAMAVIGKA